MFHVVLFEPEIPPNTGNVIRLCANTGAYLHLIHPLGFTLDDKKLRRAGLDYYETDRIKEHANLADFMTTVQPPRLFAFTTKGRRFFHQVSYQKGDALLFGPETRGLPITVLNSIASEYWLRIPMAPTMRSLNLSNAVAVAVYEAWRQVGFDKAIL